MIPAWDQTGTPLHFHSSTTSGSASLMSARTRASVSPLQSPSSLILSSISREGDSPLVAAVLVDALFFIVGLRVSCHYVSSGRQEHSLRPSITVRLFQSFALSSSKSKVWRTAIGSSYSPGFTSILLSKSRIRVHLAHFREHF